MACTRGAWLVAAHVLVQYATRVGGSVGGGGGWQRGTYGVLAFSQDCSAYTFAFSNTTLSSTPYQLGAVEAAGSASCVASGGVVPNLGSYDELRITHGADGDLYVRYFSRLDSFVFGRAPKTAQLPSAWPSFSTADVRANSTACLGWAEKYFFPGSMASGDLSECYSGGPLLLFERPSTSNDRGASPLPAPAPTMALSPLSHFTSAKISNGPPKFTGDHDDTADAHATSSAPPAPSHGISVDANSLLRCKHCRLFPNKAVLLARPALHRSARALGSVLRQEYNTTRTRGRGVTGQ